MVEVLAFESIAQAAAALRDRTVYLGGGTLVMRAVNFGDSSIERIVLANDPSVKAIRTEGNRVVLGSGATMADVLASKETAFLASVARGIGGPAVRSMATVGGNLFAQHPYGDFAAAILALDAKLSLTDGSEIDMGSFLARRGSLRSLVARIQFERPASGEFHFRKMSRVKPKGVSVISIAALIPNSAGRVSNARIAYCGMGETPVRASAAEAALEGRTLDPQGIAAAVSAASAGLAPPDDAIASSWYRKEVAPVLLRRLLLGEAD
ncbi:MAG: FAD binding domain-containing protein [Albidovulum sp.]|nr:FAD binding domain-containing protein [Albidovulum sp.]MDE0307310.1 FAD binding domain-containing protein [Albidovulum sp.]MDE0530883.1 FAD binding domain-containing protein [Albidovulum sp.]